MGWEKLMTIDDLVLESEYADILISLMQPPYNISSITKLVFIAFCSKYEKNLASYKNRSKDFVDIFFQNISLKLSAHYKDISCIMHVIDILKKTSKAKIDGDHIELKLDVQIQTENDFIKFCKVKIPNPIIEINKLDTKALVEEVIRYV